MPDSESGSACEEEDVLVFEDEEDDILFFEDEKLAMNSAWQPLHAAGQFGNSQPTSAIQQSHRKQQPARDHLRPVSAGRQSLRPSDVRLARSCAGESSAERWSNGEDSRPESASSVAESEASLLFAIWSFCVAVLIASHLLKISAFDLQIDGNC